MSQLYSHPEPGGRGQRWRAWKAWNVFKVSGRKGALIRHGIILGALVLAGLGALVAPTLARTFASAPCPGTDQTYHVSWGDTLSGIAYSYGTTVTILANHNQIANPNFILAGQRICIPGTAAEPINFVPSVGETDYVSLARQYATEFGISPDLFVRQINQESGFNPNAISWAGAIGIAQFMPATAAGLGVNPYDPVDALRGSASLMASYVNQYGSYAKALAAYNAGPGAVQYAVNAGGANWQAYLPSETQHYIAIILG